MPFDRWALTVVSSSAYRNHRYANLQPAGAGIPAEHDLRRTTLRMATDNSQHDNPQGGGATGTVERSAHKPAEKMTPLNAADDSIDPQEYSRLLDLYDNSFRNIAEGEVVKGTVLKVTPSEVIVDVGYKSEGIIPVDEFIDENGQITVQPGDMVDVLLERTEDREGYVVL